MKNIRYTLFQYDTDDTDSLYSTRDIKPQRMISAGQFDTLKEMYETCVHRDFRNMIEAGEPDVVVNKLSAWLSQGNTGYCQSGNYVMSFQYMQQSVFDVLYNRRTHEKTTYHNPARPVPSLVEMIVNY